jgi:hypothetical protein
MIFKTNIFIALASIVIIGGGVFLGLNRYIRSIYNQRTCEWANIDNIELHAEIDIPDILNCDCSYKKELNTKMASFDLDMKNLDMKNYIQRNKFKRLIEPSEISFDKLLNIKMDPDDIVHTNEVYYTKGTYKGETWQTLLDNQTGKLWVTIEYAN